MRVTETSLKAVAVTASAVAAAVLPPLVAGGDLSGTVATAIGGGIAALTAGLHAGIAAPVSDDTPTLTQQ
jgi:hypothetical protein